MSKKYVDDCGGLKPIVIPKMKDEKKKTTKKTVKKTVKKSK